MTTFNQKRIKELSQIVASFSKYSAPKKKIELKKKKFGYPFDIPKKMLSPYIEVQKKISTPIFDIPKKVIIPEPTVKTYRGKDGGKGDKGEKGDRGLQGEKGDVGLKGKDGVDGKNLDPETALSIAEKLNTQNEILNSSVIKDYIKPDDIVARILKELSKQDTQVKNNTVIKGKGLNMSDQRWHGSGITSLIAGSNITLTPTTDGGYTIASTSGASNGYQVPIGIVDGSNAVFVFTSAPNAIVVDGVSMRAIANDGTVNWTGTQTITLTIAPNFDIYAVA